MNSTESSISTAGAGPLARRCSAGSLNGNQPDPSLIDDETVANWLGLEIAGIFLSAISRAFAQFINRI